MHVTKLVPNLKKVLLFPSFFGVLGAHFRHFFSPGDRSADADWGCISAEGDRVHALAPMIVSNIGQLCFGSSSAQPPILCK